MDKHNTYIEKISIKSALKSCKKTSRQERLTTSGKLTSERHTERNSDGGVGVRVRGREGHVRVARQAARQGQVVVGAPHVLQRLQLVEARAGHAHASVHVLHGLPITVYHSLN